MTRCHFKPLLDVAVGLVAVSLGFWAWFEHLERQAEAERHAQTLLDWERDRAESTAALIQLNQIINALDSGCSRAAETEPPSAGDLSPPLLLTK